MVRPITGHESTVVVVVVVVVAGFVHLFCDIDDFDKMTSRQVEGSTDTTNTQSFKHLEWNVDA